ncbi:MAG: hypothetical protein Q7I97_04580, partial [Thermovirgaceae bacterium]|nr:hypothetical protein [Thermovirgaceae bacterium]
THEAQFSLSTFIREDRSLNARPLRQREFNITFRREVLQHLPSGQRRMVHFINHISPLIRWITQINRERAHSFFDVSALLITHPDLPPGDYCYRIERWKLQGLSVRETLAYGIQSLIDERSYTMDESETIVQYLLRRGGDWDYVDCDMTALLPAHKALEADLAASFSSTVEDFEVVNDTSYQIKVQRVQGFFDRRIAQHEQRIRTLRETGKDHMIPAAAGLLRTAEKNKEQRLNELKEKVQLDMEQAQVAAGVFRVTGA